MIGNSWPEGARFVVDRDTIRPGERLVVGGTPWRLFRFRATVTDPDLLQPGAVVTAQQLRVDTLRRLTAVGILHPDPLSLPEISADSVTVVIPVRDRVTELRRALADLAPVLPCIVVDDASRDPAAVRRVVLAAGAQYVGLTHNVGPGGARNAGLTHVRTPLVAFVDSDMRLRACDILMLARHFADPRVAAVAPRVVADPDPAVRSRVTMFEEPSAALDMGRRPAVVGPGARLSYVPTACLVCRTDMLGDAFEPELRTGEDVDLVWRMVRAGGLVRYEPAVVAAHSSRPTFRGWIAQHYGYGLSAAPLAQRHGDQLAPARFTPWSAVASAAALATAAALAGGPRAGRPSTAWGSLAVLMGSVVVGTAQTHGAVRRVGPDLEALAGQLTTVTLAGALRQSMTLALRHWAPVTATLCLVSKRARQISVALVVIDAAVESRGAVRRFPALLVSRVVSQAAYGAGVWVGAIRGREARCLAPAFGSSAPAPTIAEPVGFL